MMLTKRETIAAIATPIGRGGVGIIRVSGAESAAIAAKILGKCPEVRFAEYHSFKDDQGQTLDQGIALYFKAPHSFTGEDVLELQGHGGAFILDRLLQRVLSLGARMAKPGEFSERAFLNGKIDLTQAEAIADLIDASSEKAALCAMRSLQGYFSEKIHQLNEKIIHLRMYVEASLDFSEEEIDFLSDGKVLSNLEDILKQAESVKTTAAQGTLLQEGMNVVIAGKPNAGKSSLLNALSQKESAIVTDIPGTTRDVIKESIHIDGMPLHVIDTAGIRDNPELIEKEGIKRTWNEIQKADCILLVSDILDTESEWKTLKNEIQNHIAISKPVILLKNKIDIQSISPALIRHEDCCEIRISAKNNQGLDLLKTELKKMMGFKSNTEGVFSARRRHLYALDESISHLQAGIHRLQEHHLIELLAEDLRQAQQALNEITGVFTSDDLLSRIFSSFCVGK